MTTKFPVNKLLIIIVAAVLSFGLGWLGGELMINLGYLPLKSSPTKPPPAPEPAPAVKPEVAPPPAAAPPPPVSAPLEKPIPLPVAEAPKPPAPPPDTPVVAAKPPPVETPAAVPAPAPTAPEAKKPEPEAAPPPAPEPEAAPPPAPEPVKAKAPEPTPPRLDVLNGMGKKGFAQEMRRKLVKKGYQVVAIGDYSDFDVETTEILYRSKHKKVAQALKAKVFPTAMLKHSGDMAPDVDIRIILGADLAPEEEAAEGDKAAAPAPLAKKEEASPPTPVKTQPKPEVKASPPASPPAPAKSPAPPATPDKSRPGVLSAADLMGTAIDLRNGNGAQDLCKQVRARLSGEGFRVAAIGNHVDFGQEITAIYYRPGKEKVAQALKAKFFPGASLQPGPNLSPGVDVKVILGHDLKTR
ncbi:MAG: LytR C-terminal domain-containing protein [Thermodesulfobacteriota bacterium]